MTPEISLSLDVVQGSEEWLQARVGLVTGSRCFDAFSKTEKGKYTAARAKYCSELICERLTNRPYPRKVTPEMQWGIDKEPLARAAYENHAGVLVDTCGFVLHPEIDRFGASPDGLVGDDGLIQIKCPATLTHIAWLRAGTVPLEHMPQMVAEMSCTGRDWCDFVSFDPRLPRHLQLFVRRFDRDNKLIHAIEANVDHFNAEIDQSLAGLPEKPQAIAEVLEWPKLDEPEY